MANRELDFDDLVNPILFFGEHDQNIRLLEKEFFVSIFPKGNCVRIEGEKENIDLVEKTLDVLFHESQMGNNLKENDLDILVHQIKEDEKFQIDGLSNEKIVIPKSGKVIKPKTTHQAKYLKAIKESDLVFGIGPAGTGKTYLAVALGLSYLLQDKVQRLILTRPVVEAGESLGFLPGDLQQKINPYLRPLFDAIFDMMSYEDFVRYRDKERIEIAQKLYELRTKANLTQKQLAKLIGTRQSVISRLESAEYKGHTLKILNKIGEAVHCHVKIDFIL